MLLLNRFLMIDWRILRYFLSTSHQNFLICFVPTEFQIFPRPTDEFCNYFLQPIVEFWRFFPQLPNFAIFFCGRSKSFTIFFSSCAWLKSFCGLPSRSTGEFPDFFFFFSRSRLTNFAIVSRDQLANFATYVTFSPQLMTFMIFLL